MTTQNNLAGLIGRLLLAGFFLWSAYGKILNPGGTAQFIQSVGLPGNLVWPVIAAEVAGGLGLAFGLLTRLAALGLAVFSVVAGLYFHSNFGDMNQAVHFGKNVAIAGGLLSIVMSGAGAWSLDHLVWRSRSTRVEA